MKEAFSLGRNDMPDILPLRKCVCRVHRRLTQRLSALVSICMVMILSHYLSAYYIRLYG